MKVHINMNEAALESMEKCIQKHVNVEQEDKEILQDFVSEELVFEAAEIKPLKIHKGVHELVEENAHPIEPVEEKTKIVEGAEPLKESSEPIDKTSILMEEIPVLIEEASNTKDEAPDPIEETHVPIKEVHKRKNTHSYLFILSQEQRDVIDIVSSTLEKKDIIIFGKMHLKGQFG